MKRTLFQKKKICQRQLDKVMKWRFNWVSPKGMLAELQASLRRKKGSSLRTVVSFGSGLCNEPNHFS